VVGQADAAVALAAGHHRFVPSGSFVTPESDALLGPQTEDGQPAGVIPATRPGTVASLGGATAELHDRSS